jgi:alpha-beta hydrolase superfamily lysophospholipase
MDLVDDACYMIRFLKSRPEVNPERVIILGHSEGSLIAPAVNNREQVAGLVLLAGAADPGHELTPRQSRKLFKEIAELPGFKGKLLRF